MAITATTVVLQILLLLLVSAVTYLVCRLVSLLLRRNQTSITFTIEGCDVSRFYSLRKLTGIYSNANLVARALTIYEMLAVIRHNEGRVTIHEYGEEKELTL